jgi:ankyrin repeat protein
MAKRRLNYLPDVRLKADATDVTKCGEPERLALRRMKHTLLIALVAIASLTVGGAELKLEDAVKAGNRDAVRALLATPAGKPSVNTAEPDGTTPLHWAARADDVDMAKLLVAAGANVNAANRYGVSPLSLAAGNASGAMVAVLLDAGADARAVVKDGETVLMAAARSGNPDAVGRLIERGAVVDAREQQFGETALMWAAAENHPEAAKLLIDHGADVNARTTSLVLPKDRFGLEGVLTILPHGRWMPLMYAARQGSLEAARTLVDAGAELNALDPDRSTPAMIATINGHYDVAAMLVERGADPNITDTAGTALLYAAVDMNTLGEVYGRPARKPASAVSALGLMKIVLAHGADPNAQLRSSTVQRAHTPGEPLLGAGTTPIMRAAKNGDAAAMRILLDRGADPALRQANHTTALMFAAGDGRGTGVFTKDIGTERDLIESVKVLVEQGVDVNAFNDNGQTAMHFAAQVSDDIVRYLAAHGAKIDSRDRQGHTPVDLALGIGARGRAGGPPPVRQGTAALLRELMDEQAKNASPRQ